MDTKSSITFLNQDKFLYQDDENKLIVNYEDLRTGSCQVFIEPNTSENIIQKIKISLKEHGFNNEIEFYNISIKCKLQ